MKKSLVGVDVANAMQQRLIQQRSFDRRLASPKECDELFERNGKRFGTGPFVFCVGRDDGETAKAAGVDKTKLFAAAQGQDSMGVRGDGGLGCGDQQASGHAEVYEELRGRLFAREIDDDGLANAVDAVDAAASKGLDDFVRRRFERLRLVAGPDRADGLAVNAFVDAVGDRFDFGEFGHAF